MKQNKTSDNDSNLVQISRVDYSMAMHHKYDSKTQELLYYGNLIVNTA